MAYQPYYNDTVDNFPVPVAPPLPNQTKQHNSYTFPYQESTPVEDSSLKMSALQKQGFTKGEQIRVLWRAFVTTDIFPNFRHIRTLSKFVTLQIFLPKVLCMP